MGRAVTREHLLQYLLAWRLAESLRLVHDRCLLGLESTTDVSEALRYHEERRLDFMAALLEA